jgi:hypothetical protein
VVVLAAGFFGKGGTMEEFRCFYCDKILLEGDTIEIISEAEDFEEFDGIKDAEVLEKCYLHLMCISCSRAKPKEEIDQDITDTILLFRKGIYRPHPKKWGFVPTPTIGLLISSEEYTKGKNRLR